METSSRHKLLYPLETLLIIIFTKNLQGYIYRQAQALHGLGFSDSTKYDKHRMLTNTDHEQAKLVDSPLGRVPEGWQLSSASEAIQINSRTKLAKEGETPFVPMSDLSVDSMLIGDIQPKYGNSGAKFINGDTLLTNTESRLACKMVRSVMFSSLMMLIR